MRARVEKRKDWKRENPVLEDGEFGYEKETRELKIGDGSTRWIDLPYYSIGASTDNAAYVAGSDRLVVETDYAASQTLTDFGGPYLTTLDFDTPQIDVGTAFTVATKSVHITEGTAFSGYAIIDVSVGPSSDVMLMVYIQESLGDGTGGTVGTDRSILVYVKQGATPYLYVPFHVAGFTPGNYLQIALDARGADLDVDSFGGMELWRVA